MGNARRVLVTGAGGFIGHHLVKLLKSRGHIVRGVDLKPPAFEPSWADEFWQLDLRELPACVMSARGMDDVYHLAADMGGIGFISRNFASVARNNSLVNLHMLHASQRESVERFLFSSTACVYNLDKQRSPDATPLRECDAHPAAPEKGYGWEKLYAEQLCAYYRQDFGLATRIARLHNIFGPLGTYDGGREKAPAAACRKVALAEPGGAVEIWGDGRQSRSFLYIDDCTEGLVRLMESEYGEPLNIGSQELVTIDRLFDLVAQIAGKQVRKVYRPGEPQGVRGRSSDSTLARRVLNWAPATPLRDGLVPTYAWIAAQVSAARSESAAASPGKREASCLAVE